MFNLFDMFLVMLFTAFCAWLWHVHGLRERALELVKHHCARVDVELLDGNVALRRIAFEADSKGRKRLARVYGFEFTVTGEQRHTGSIIMFGRHLGRIELAPHPMRELAPEDSNVIELAKWREAHRPDQRNISNH
jgi:hypothetical protein